MRDNCLTMSSAIMPSPIILTQLHLELEDFYLTLRYDCDDINHHAIISFVEIDSCHSLEEH